jgi:hypothetical protein
VPRHYCEPAIALKFDRLAERAQQSRSLDLVAEFEALAADISPRHSWFHGASLIYTNWLAYLSERRQGRPGATHVPIEAAAPHLAA